MKILIFSLACMAFLSANAQTLAQNKAVTDAFYVAFNGDAAKFDASALVAPDFIDHAIPSDVWMQMGANGIERFQNSIVAFKQAFPDVHVRTLKTVAEGNTVMVYLVMTGTFTNDFMGLKATGKSFKLNDVDIVEFNNSGKATAHWAVQDAAVMWMQLGVKM